MASPTILRWPQIAKAAELTALAEQTRADAMRGRVTPDDVVRIERLALAAERALPLPPPPPADRPELPSLDVLIQRRRP